MSFIFDKIIIYMVRSCVGLSFGFNLGFLLFLKKNVEVNTISAWVPDIPLTHSRYHHASVKLTGANTVISVKMIYEFAESVGMGLQGFLFSACCSLVVRVLLSSPY